MRIIARTGGYIALATLLAVGCRHAPRVANPEPIPIALPVWFTRPTVDAQARVPVDLNIRLPGELRAMAQTHALPDWMIYGVVRALGATEFLAAGTFRRFTLADDMGQSSVVEDAVTYDVAGTAVRQALDGLARACAEAETERERRDILGRHVYRRFGSYILFDLIPRAADADNLLLNDGVARDPMEVFTPGATNDLPAIGWTETATDFIETHAGAFSYANPFEAFRRTEEEAIRELAKTLLMRFSHMSRDLEHSTDRSGEGYREDVIREDIRLRLRGVRILRRAIDPDRNLCIVQVAVRRDGVARD